MGAGCGLEDYDGNSVSRFCEGGWSDILRCFFFFVKAVVATKMKKLDRFTEVFFFLVDFL